ncbi:hypothetical protein [Prochlorococcus sp. MIT 1223]|uniref:hypothetical protein n=1 Tax=Prochlorococcus sp. MIT 1223 TaxID=3096217 RepID=UPI002A7554CA|nr:hypothetical protein [Prochlorococcus sp. MIT 1223]
MNKPGPSKFSVQAFATDDLIWDKILETLSQKEREEADKSESEINEPYMGGKEIIVRRKDKTNIAFASLSETNDNNDKWAVYREK